MRQAQPDLPAGRLADHLVVFRVAANPEPDQTIRRLDSQRSMVQAHTGRVVPAHLLQAN